MSTVIKVENLSKQYRLGTVGASTFKEDAQRWFAKIRGKQDPFLNVGVENIRTLQTEEKFVWSLKDINFEVQQGDVLGVIGRNGAGKSTLLKILSKVTAPTTGSIKVKGRIASLLEVGTGFHPELTGRENIYLNGAILGMRKHEISRKLDEIVAFAGVEKYVDTPVKRYSSGMYVRLAFAVAAHLESEILIVDEVLAVGDSEFQKKCLGKMGDISKGEGRTILFVSHNITTVNNLCNNSLYLNNGLVDSFGKTCDIINNYKLSLSKKVLNSVNEFYNRKGSGVVRFIKFDIVQLENNSLSIDIYYKSQIPDIKCRFFVNIIDDFDNSIIFLDSEVITELDFIVGREGCISITTTDKVALKNGIYSVNIAILYRNEWVDHVENAACFEYYNPDFFKNGKSLYHQSTIIPDQIWKHQLV